MSIDYTSQIKKNTKELLDLAKNSQDINIFFQKNAVGNAIQVGDYSLPDLSKTNSIEALQTLSSLIEALDSNFKTVDPSVEGAKVPIAPTNLDSITPSELLDAMIELQQNIASITPQEVIPADLETVLFCPPDAPPPPQVSFEDFNKLCEEAAPPPEPSKKLEAPPNPDLDEAFKDIDSLPEDNPASLEDRNKQLDEAIKALENLDAYGSPSDVLNAELAKSDVGKLLIDFSNKVRSNLGTDLVDNDGNPLVPNSASGIGNYGDGLNQNDIDALRNSVNNSDLEGLNETPPKPEEKVAIDCVKIMKPIIEESQKKGERFGAIKTEIADIKQEANIGKVFLAFWNTVNQTLNDTKFKALNDLTKTLNEKEKEKEDTPFYNIIKINSLNSEIDEIRKKQSVLIRTYTNESVLIASEFLEANLKKIVIELSIEIDIEFQEYKSPKFLFDKSKSSQKSDRRIQKIQDKLTNSIKKIDVSKPESIEEIKKLQTKSDKEYNDEISNAINRVQELALGWSINTLARGGSRLDYVKKKVSENNSSLKSLYEPKAKKLDDLQKEEAEIQKYLDELNTTIKDRLKEQGCELPEINVPIDEAGEDVNFKGIPMDASKSPNIFDIRWWRKFCTLATLVNLAPLYWPVGLILPTIPKPLFIPCPIIWQPLAVFNTPIALIVILIGQCGVLPSPFVFVLNTGPIPLGPLTPQSAWFPVAIRPMCKVKDNPTSEKLPGAPEIMLPLANPADVQKQIDALKKQIEENNNKINQNTEQIKKLTNENIELAKKIQDLEKLISDEIERQKQNIQKLQDAVKQNEKESAELAKQTEDANKSIEEANKAMEEAKAQVEKNTKAVKDAEEAAKKSAEKVKEAAKKLKSANDKKNEAVKQYEDVSKQLELVKDNPILAVPLAAKVASLAAQISSIENDVSGAIADAKVANEEADKARNKVLEANAELKKSNEKIKQAQAKIKSAQQKIQELTKAQQDLLKSRGELNTKISESGKNTDSQNSIESTKDKINSNNKSIQKLIKDNANLLQTNAKLQAKIVELSTVLEVSKTQKTKIELDPKITAMMPLYKDDLPTWERLSITNIPFLLFLTQWCGAGKNGGGFLRDPI
jgi:uncharacterized coiled-coil DUF342 family protein